MQVGEPGAQRPPSYPPPEINCTVRGVAASEVDPDAGDGWQGEAGAAPLACFFLNCDAFLFPNRDSPNRDAPSDSPNHHSPDHYSPDHYSPNHH